ncbi:MAG TPA: transglutaminase-like domain-containing protein [Gemmataceae bacterium]|nr:transglutaminase-like domain-containing protein [Gemmataceae bacterium]
MRRLYLLLTSLALAAGLGLADDTIKTSSPKPATLKTPAPKPLEEVWEAAYVRNDAGTDVKIGHVHMTSVPVEKDGQKLIRTTKELRLVVGRADAKAEMKADVSSDEDADGKVQAITAKIWLGKDKVQKIDCEVLEGNKVRVTAGVGAVEPRVFNWDPANVGLAREQTLLRDKKVKPGDAFTYRYYEVTVTHPVTVRVAVKDLEEVPLPGGVKRKLLKVVATPDALTVSNGAKLQMPAGTFWADPVSYDTIKTEMDIPEIGKVSLIRTSKVAALAPNGQVPDLMKRQSIYLKAAIPDMHDRDAIVYRVTFQGDAQPKELVATDARQAIRNVNGKSFELAMTARRGAVTGGADEKAGPEFLRSNYFINSDDAEVKKLATRAVGRETDPWKKAQKIEGFVREFMRPADYTEAMAPADHVAKTRTGDCTEYAMLTAAMCRAAGVPSRTAIGLVYVNNLLGRPALAFHMWTEVHVNGQWLGLDATLGRGSIGPGHIKITDHSWDGVISFTPLLPVKGFIMANPTIEVVGK